MANKTDWSLQGSKERNKKKKQLPELLITHSRENCKQTAYKSFCFSFLLSICSLIAHCVQWISHLLLWLEWMKLRPFPYMAGPFNHQGARSNGILLGLQCPLLYEISFPSEHSLLGFWPNFLLSLSFRGCVENQTKRASFSIASSSQWILNSSDSRKSNRPDSMYIFKNPPYHLHH